MRTAALMLALVGCAPRVLVDVRPLAIVGTPVPAPVSPAVEPPPTNALGPFRKAGPILFTPSTVPATITPQARALASWSGTIDGSARAEIGCRNGVRWRDTKGDREVARQADHVSVAPDGSELVVGRGKTLSRHLLAPSGSPPVTLEGDRAAYAARHALAVRRGCMWFAFAEDGATIEIGEACGDLVRGERSRPRWWFAEVGDAAAGAAGFSITAAVALGPDAPPLRVDFGGRAARAIAVSPDGEIVCGIFRDHEHDVLDCRGGDRGDFERIASDVFGAPRFAEGGRRMVFTTGDEDHVPRSLELVDFQHRLIRRLGRIAHHRFDFLPGGDHVVAYDGARGLVFELETGFATPFGDADDDWVALGAADRPGSFLASRLRARCAELVRVDLPPEDAAR